jgi:hypothetical protein
LFIFISKGGKMKKVQILILMLCMSTLLFARNTKSSDGGQFGARFDLGFPLGEYADNVDRIGAGVALHGAYFPNPYFSAGLGGGFMSYGSTTSKIHISSLVEDVEMNTSNNVGNLFV